jgi:hypothetical protein
MKVYDIISEKRIDEALPLLGIPAILAAVSFFMAGLTAMQLYEFVKKYNEDPDAVTDDEWNNIFFDLAFAAIPAFGRLSRPLLIKAIPDKLKSTGGQWAKKKVQELMAKDKTLKKDISKADDKFGADARLGKSPEKVKAMRAKNIQAIRKAKEQAAKRAESTVKKLQATKIFGPLSALFSAGVIGKLSYDYWNKVADIEEQIKLRNEGNLETPLFKDMEINAANQLAADLKAKAVGELTLAVGAALGSIAIAKKVEFLNGILGKVMPGGKLVKGLVTLPGNVAASLVRSGGTGVALFMQTESGQKLLQTEIVSMITTIGGSVMVNAWDALIKGLELAAKTAGIDITPATNKIKTNIKSPDELNVGPGASTLAATKDPYGLALTTDPNNPNIKRIGGHPVTGPDGYVLSTIQPLINRLREKAKAFNVPDPFAQLKFDPNKNYGNISGGGYQDALK